MRELGIIVWNLVELCRSTDPGIRRFGIARSVGMKRMRLGRTYSTAARIYDQMMLRL
jgi:hypothetical protein